MSPDSDLLKLRLPFGPGDVFGYVIPGAAFLVSVCVFDFWLNATLNSDTHVVHVPFFKAVDIVRTQASQVNAVWSAAALLLVLGVAYVCGHVVSSLSSFAIDRSLIYKGHGYPYAHLLGLEPHRPRTYSAAFYRGVFFWFNLHLAALYIAWFIGPRWSHLFEATTFVRRLAFWPVRHAQQIGMFSGWLVLISICLKLLSGPIHKVIPRSSVGKLRPAVKWIGMVYSSPYDLLANVFSRGINSGAPLEPEIVATYCREFARRFGMTPQQAGSNNYWFSVIYVSEHSPMFHRQITNWLNLYQYARNLSTGFYLAALYCWVALVAQGGMIGPDAITRLFVPFYALIAVVMLSRYYYLYACYYTKFILRSLVYAWKQDERPPALILPK